MKIQDVRFQNNCFQKEVDRPLSPPAPARILSCGHMQFKSNISF